MELLSDSDNGDDNGHVAFRLSTKGCCFICLKPVSVSKLTSPSSKNEGQLLSLRALVRFLEINVKEVAASTFTPSELQFPINNSESGDVEAKARFCDSCFENFSKFSAKFQQYERLEMEMCQYLGSLRKLMTTTMGRESEALKQYQSLAGDSKSAKQSKFVRRLRGLVVEKCKMLI